MNRNWNRTKTWLPSLISICSLIAAADLVHQMADFCIISCWFALIAINCQQGLAVSPASLLLRSTAFTFSTASVDCYSVLGCGRTVLHLHTSAQGELLQLQVQLTKLRTQLSSIGKPSAKRTHSLSLTHSHSHTQRVATFLLSACFGASSVSLSLGKSCSICRRPPRDARNTFQMKVKTLWHCLCCCCCCARLFTCLLPLPMFRVACYLGPSAIAACISINEELSR